MVALAALLWGNPAAAQSTAAEGPDIRPPAPVTVPEIVYPEGLSEPVTGTVALRFTVTVSGTVTNVTVLSASAAPFTTPVIDAIRAAVFRPATRDGTPFAADIEVELEVPPPARLTAPPRARLVGTVYALGSRQPVAGAQVSVVQGGATTGTTTGGRFSLAIPPGPVTIVVTASGYRIARFDENLEADVQLEVVYRLEPENVSPWEIVVEAERERAEVSRVQLDTKELRRVPGTFDDAVRVVQKLPSVAQPNEFSGELLVRGSDARDTVIYVDGILIPFIFHFGAIKSVIASEFIQEVVLYPSNFSVRYGNAIGGVLDVRLKDPGSDRWQGRALVSSLLSEAAADGPLGDNWGLQIGARTSYAHLFLGELIPPSSGIAFNTLPKFRDYQARLVYNNGPWTGRLFVFGAVDELAAAQEAARTLDEDDPFSEFTQRQDQYNFVGKMDYAQGSVTGNTVVAFSLDNLKFRLANNERFELHTETWTFRSDWEVGVRPVLSVAGGVEWFDQTIEPDIFIPRPPRPGEFDYDFQTAERIQYGKTSSFDRGGVYSELRIGRDSGVHGAAGLRLNLDVNSGVPTLDPRGLLFVPGGAAGTFKAGLGLYTQYAKDQQGVVEPVGNPDVGPSRAVHTMVGWQRDLIWDLEASAELFYKWIYQLITENPDPFDPVRFRNVGEGRAYGFEVSLKKPLTDTLTGWINYSFTRSFRTVAPGEPEEPFEFDQPHVLNLIASWLPTANWEVGGSFRYASGNPKDKLLQRLYLGDRASYVPVYAELAERQDPFMRLDGRVKYTWLFDRWKLGLLLEVLNVTNRDNVLFTQFNPLTGESESISGFPVLPYVGVEASF